MKNVEIAAIRSKFHSGYQSIDNPRKTGYGKRPNIGRFPVCAKFVYLFSAVKPTASNVALDFSLQQNSKNALAVSTFLETFRTAAG